MEPHETPEIPSEVLEYINKYMLGEGDAQTPPEPEEVFGGEEEPQVKVEEPPKETQQVEEPRKYAKRFNTVEDLEKSYLELQREYSRIQNKFKNFEKFENLIKLLEQDPGLARKIMKVVMEYYENPEPEEEFDFEEKETYNKQARFNPVEIENLVSKKVEEKVQEVFQALNMLTDFARSKNLERDELEKVIKIAQEKGLTLDEAYEEFISEKERMKKKILQELGINPQSLGASKATPPKTLGLDTNANLSGERATSTPTGYLEKLKKGWNALSREEQLEILRKYGRYI